jgi:ribosomal protein S18 acetylase RimI-like enzyme
MEDLHIRTYQEEDNDAVWQLHVDGLNQTGSFIKDPKLDADLHMIQATYLDNGGEFFVVVLGNEIVAMGALKKVNDQTAEIKRMRVKINYQRQGIGSIMLKKLIESAKELGYRKLILDTSANQTAAKQLYEKFGFREYKRGEIGNLKTHYYELSLLS